jgi:hypothetical protein
MTSRVIEPLRGEAIRAHAFPPDCGPKERNDEEG